MATKKKATENGHGTNRIAGALDKSTNLVIQPANLQYAHFTIVGTAPLVLHHFGKTPREAMKAKQQAGSTAAKGKKRDPKDFERCFREAQYISDEGWQGFPAGAIRTAMCDACRTVGFQMTKAKLAVFCEPDGFDKDEGVPLVKITKGKPEMFEKIERNETGVADIRVRPMWKPGWEADIRIKFDADMFTLADVANLLVRVGEQVGIGEGRHNSKKSYGCGWGTFRLKDRG